MKGLRLAGMVLAGVVVALAANSASAGDGWRPCGPGGCLNKLIPQGAYGADFRPACARHDACYTNGCDRAACDKQFYNDMCAACECSNRPGLCRCRAKCMYMAVKLFNCGGANTCNSSAATCGQWECFTSSASCCDSGYSCGH